MQNQNKTAATATSVTPKINPSFAFLRLPLVMAKVQMSRSWIYLQIQKSEFPRPIKIGSASLWIESEIDRWLTKQIEHSHGAV